jgi:hypothetical protein
VKATLLSCVLLLALTNCASSGDADLDGGDVDAAIKTDAAKTDAANKPDTGGPQCIAQCTSDDDCSGSCPEVPNGVSCCDISTGICYSYNDAVCPAPVQDAGFD